jgi:hypothetical protein
MLTFLLQHGNYWMPIAGLIDQATTSYAPIRLDYQIKHEE